MFAHLRLLTTLVLLSAALPASAQWTNGQNAQFVIGQPDFDTWGLATSQNQMGLAYGIAIDTTHSKVYVCDQIAHRVLRYSYPIIANQPNAEIVFGQANFTDSTSNAGGLSGSSLQNPSELEVDATGRLWISDMSNNRVLAFDNAHLIASNKPTADKVLGQPTMSSVGAFLNQSGLSQPFGITMDPEGRLYVTDTNHHRILRFDAAASKPDGGNADAVVGQVNFTSDVSALDQSHLAFPSDVAISGSTLFVSDSFNTRVLRYDNILAKANGAPADGVLGQANFTTEVFGPTATTYSSPQGVAVDKSGRLYVSDPGNNRILIYNNAASKANGAAANNVLGQANLTSSNFTITQNTSPNLGYLAVDSVNGKLLAASPGAQRVMVWSAGSPLPVGLSGFSLE